MGLLPITLLKFWAVKDDNHIKISWTTATEINNEFFILEKSANALDFEKIAKIQGAGNSSTMLNYHYIDNMPYSGDNYYRLTQVDYDGTSETFNIIHANCDNNNNEIEISVYPTVFDSNVNVYIKSFNDEKLNFEIFDLQGKLVYKQIIQNNEISYENILNLSDIKPSVYILKVYSDNHFYSTRIIKLP